MGGVEISILTFIAFTCMPAFTNRNGVDILPGYWAICFPLTYYVIGFYIRQNTIRIKKKYLMPIVIIILLGEPLANICVNGKDFLYFYGGHDSIVYLVLSVALFLLMIDSQPNSKLFMGTVNMVAELSLYIYLIGYLFDTIFSKTICRGIKFGESYQYFPFDIGCFALSLAASFVVAFVYDALYKWIKKNI